MHIYTLLGVACIQTMPGPTLHAILSIHFHNGTLETHTEQTLCKHGPGGLVGGLGVALDHPIIVPLNPGASYK